MRDHFGSFFSILYLTSELLSKYHSILSKLTGVANMMQQKISRLKVSFYVKSCKTNFKFNFLTYMYTWRRYLFQFLKTMISKLVNSGLIHVIYFFIKFVVFWITEDTPEPITEVFVYTLVFRTVWYQGSQMWNQKYAQYDIL